jgi:hypothetical protein
VTEIETYTITTKGADTAADADKVAAVLEVFEVTPTVDNEGKLTVKYEFGISDIKNNGDGSITFTAGVDENTAIREEVTVTFYADGAEIGTGTLSDDGKTASAKVWVNYLPFDISGKEITVEATTPGLE